MKKRLLDENRGIRLRYRNTCGAHYFAAGVFCIRKTTCCARGSK
ncbi:hypothetical protein CLOSTMETH_00547 [[Clostridium] methylpentosum DSM 5476]|uniref:Uncharacterized protein n=1 Tax=[Clostridium] methylpentosum DSM 5476 TaxID=537013 RepID=C0E9P8_9FIRM|nr:hypothetical protein CLOSTMETH_00547 [[Clostridium] methylpentosum DSM 5476]